MKWNKDTDLYRYLELVSTNNWKVEMWNEYVTYYISCDMEQDLIFSFLNDISDNTSFSYFYNVVEREILFTAKQENNWHDMTRTFLPDLLALLSTLGEDTDWHIKQINSPIMANANIILEHSKEHYEYVISNPELAEHFTYYIQEYHPELLQDLEREINND